LKASPASSTAPTPDTGRGDAPSVNLGACGFRALRPRHARGDTDHINPVGLPDLRTVLGNVGSTLPAGPADGDTAPFGNPNGTASLNDLLTTLATFGSTCP
jgi:hypothetical protein